MEKTVKKKSGLATAGMVLGIIGVCTSFIPLVNNAAFVLGALSVIFGIITLIKKESLGKTIAALICGVLAIVIMLVSQASLAKAIDDIADDIDNELGAMTGEQTDSILENNLDVTIGKFVVTEGDFLDESELKVTVNNKGSETASFTVEIEAVGSDGSRIDTDTIYINDLKAGQKQEFEAFTLVKSDKYNALEKATFKVLEVSML